MRRIGPPGLGLTVGPLGGTSMVVRATGELDIGTAPALAGAIDGAATRGCHTIVVDLTRLDFIDTSGMHVLVDAHDALKARRVRLLVVCGERVQRVIRLLGLEDRLECGAHMWSAPDAAPHAVA